jgi:ABC-2 type transport system permease protein
MTTLRSFLGVIRYEYRMQVRRPAVWVLLGIIALFPLSSLRNLLQLSNEHGVAVTFADWSFLVNTLLPVGFGVLLADRLPRDRRFRVDDLLGSVPLGPAWRLVGKYSGSTLATMTPIALVYVAGAAVVAHGDPGAIPAALAVFFAVNVPGMLFVAAFSVACPALLWVPLYQFLFVGYWFWGNFLNPDMGIPTLAETALTPLGTWASQGLFQGGSMVSGTHTPGDAALSIALLLGGAVAALVAGHVYLRWEAART